MAKQTIKIKDTTVRIEGDFICLTDIAKSGRSPAGDIIKNYLRNRSNIEFLGLWEQLNNQSFNSVNFHLIRNDLGLNDFILSVSEWIKKTDARGIRSKAGRYGGTFAHKDIAFQFATWFSPSFYLYLIKEYERLKNDEAVRLGLTFDLRREITKTNYSIQTDAIKNNLLTDKIRKTKNDGKVYASEADLLNVIVFGTTAKQWKAANTGKKGNMRDHASIEELLLLLNMESLNGTMINWEYEQEMRAEILKVESDRQRPIIAKDKAVKRIAKADKKKLK